jgi:hypothetical protein
MKQPCKGADLVGYARLLGMCLLACLGLTACVGSSRPFTMGFKGYEGAARPRSETATVFMIPGEYSSLHGFIRTVDEQAIQSWVRAAPLEVYVLPGRHDFGLLFGSGRRLAHGSMAVDATAGHTYEIRYSYADDGRKVRPWVVDLGTNYVRRDPAYLRAVDYSYPDLKQTPPGG